MGVGTLSINYLAKSGFIDNFQLVTLLNRDLKILVKMLAKTLLSVADDFIGEEQTCTVPGINIQDIQHIVRLMRYNLQQFDSKSGSGGAPIYFYHRFP